MADDSQQDVLFTVVWIGGHQPVGAPFQHVKAQTRVETTFEMMRRLQRELKPCSIIALTYLIEHGYQPGEATSFVGWGQPWLMSLGMGKSESETACRELKDKGYVKAYKVNGETKGKQRGVLTGGLIGEHTEFEGEPRRDGRPRLISLVPGNGEMVAPEPVDKPVSPKPGNGTPSHPQNREIGNTNPQVSPVSPKSGNGHSSPSSSTEIEEVLFFEATPKADFGWAVSYLNQQHLAKAIDDNPQRAITTLADALSDYETVGAQVADFLGDKSGMPPSTALATMLVDYLGGDDDRRRSAADAIRLTFKTQTVRHSKIKDDQTLRTAWVLGIITAIGKDPDTLAGWFGNICSSRQFHVTPSAREVLAAFDAILLGKSPQVAIVARTSPDQERIAHLAMIAIGTSWSDDEVTFSQFLRNTGAQKTAQNRWDAMTEPQQQRWLDRDRALQSEDESAVTYAAIAAGATWDTIDQRIVHPSQSGVA